MGGNVALFLGKQLLALHCFRERFLCVFMFCFCAACSRMETQRARNEVGFAQQSIRTLQFLSFQGDSAVLGSGGCR